ncbi:MAG: winged helix-turn-helix domain-containing protein, partial [Candidatus Micrarchaeota archaeon]
DGCDCKIFPFGVGTDIDFELLDRISNEYGDGIPTYIRSDAELEASLTLFYNKISKPLLTDVRLEIGGVETYDIYPKRIPDIFYGSQIVIVGKYTDAGGALVKISGETGGEKKTFEYEVTLPETQRNSFVERTWAARKLGYLLDIIALEGETDALKEEVVALATKYGLPSPYTSYVAINEEGEHVERSLGIMDALGGWENDANIMTTASAYKVTESYSYSPPETKTVGDKTFVSIDGLWKDTSCGESVDSTIEFGSEEYLSFISDDTIARYLSVGERVWLCTDSSVMVASSGNEPVGGIAGASTPGGEIDQDADSGGEETREQSLLDRLLPLGLLLLLAMGVVVSILLRRPQGLAVEEEEDDMRVYKSLSSDTRRGIMRILQDGEGGRTTTFISEKLGKSKATVSEHLEKLVGAQLIERDHVHGRKWVFYKLTQKGKFFLKKGG